MNVSPKAVAMIKHHEGVRQKPYKCPAKLWTVGVGHVLYPEQGKLPIDQRDGFALKIEDFRTFEMDEIDGILRADLARFERGVHTYITAPLTQSMFDALGTLQRSTLRQKLNRGDKEGAGQELLKYCMAGGKILKGLQNRRRDEHALFMS
jgi:lysozyme